jgi:hypothetical protein
MTEKEMAKSGAFEKAESSGPNLKGIINLQKAAQDGSLKQWIAGDSADIADGGRLVVDVDDASSRGDKSTNVRDFHSRQPSSISLTQPSRTTATLQVRQELGASCWRQVGNSLVMKGRLVSKIHF